VTDPATTAGAASLIEASAFAILLEPGAVTPLASLGAPAPAGSLALAGSLASAGELIVVVGPEGGISPQESAALAAAGAKPYRLGPSVLRTSTAGAVAAAVLLSRTARWA
jgi:16S rRNA (uracil1498-N3)-methyltransferase